MALSRSTSKSSCSRPECSGSKVPTRKRRRCCKGRRCRFIWEDIILCGWCRRKFSLCRKCRNWCAGKCCRKFRRRCKYLLLCRCCTCCYQFTPEDYDKAFMDKPKRKRIPPRPLPKITRREQDIKYIRRSTKHRVGNNAQPDNDTEIYFCTIKLDNFLTKCKPTVMPKTEVVKSSTGTLFAVEN
jgi:hypothetical protein